MIRAMGLQTAAGFYGILLYTAVMRGKDADPREIGLAAAIGALWGIWLHWYPIQTAIAWNTQAVTMETAMIYILPALIAIGVMLQFIAPRFRVFREDQMTLLWWEAILVGIPLFISLVVGMIPGAGGRSAIPYEWLGLAVLIGAYATWTLANRQRGFEPSILAEVTFSAPNLGTYIIFVLAFVSAGALAYNLITGPDSLVGVVIYFAIFAFAAAWLPLASLLTFWFVIHQPAAPDEKEDSDG
jgi:hypothetical protein